MFKWIFKKVNPSAILKAVEKVVSNMFADKTTDCYIEVQQITVLTQRVHELIVLNFGGSRSELASIINREIPNINVTEEEILQIQLNKQIGLRALDYRLIKVRGSEELNMMNRKNKDFLIELSIMEILASKSKGGVV